MLVPVSLERERADIIDMFKKAIKSHLKWSMDFTSLATLTSSCTSLPARWTITSSSLGELFYENPDIKGFKTMVVMDRVKAGFAIPVEIPNED